MDNGYNANQILEYEAELNAIEEHAVFAPSGGDWQRVDDRYTNCAAVWRHDSGDEIIVYHGDEDEGSRYEVLQKSAKSGTLKPLHPFPSEQEAEAFVAGIILSLDE